MLVTRTISFLTLCLVVVSLGCGAISKRPDPKWIEDFDNTDAIVLRRGDAAAVRATDSATIIRFRGIYTDSKWTPYLHTLPGDLGERTIEIYDGDTKLRAFSYLGGTLWESGSYTDNRTTVLSDGDRHWIDSLFESD